MTGVAVPVGALDRQEALDLADVEYRRLGELLTTLPPDAWTRQTDCPEWTVRDVVAHVVGLAAFGGSGREAVRQLLAGRSTGRRPPDSFNVLHVRERAGARPDELVEELRVTARRSVDARRRLPAALRRVPVPLEFSGRKPLDWLFTVVLTRDVWMHRVDIARATGRSLELTPGHDGRLVADVVAEWAAKHREAYDLTLTGPAGGHFCAGPPTEHVEIDAVEFCRILSGRAAGVGLLGVRVEF
jgi:uncharacterized protein (TIGR03083 family)